MDDTREADFMRDLQELCNKHHAEIEVTDNGKPYGMHEGRCIVSISRMNMPYLQFDLPGYLFPEEDSSDE